MSFLNRSLKALRYLTTSGSPIQVLELESYYLALYIFYRRENLCVLDRMGNSLENESTLLYGTYLTQKSTLQEGTFKLTYFIIILLIFIRKESPYLNTLIVADKFLNTNKLDALKKNEKYIITREKENKNKPQFLMIGKGVNMKNENMAVDLLKEVSQMNTNEKTAFFAIRDAMDYKDDTLSNICVDQKNYTPYQKKVFKLGVNGLIGKKLIARVKRGIYQVNPYAVIPTDFEEAKNLWLTVVKYEDIAQASKGNRLLRARGVRCSIKWYFKSIEC